MSGMRAVVQPCGHEHVRRLQPSTLRPYLDAFTSGRRDVGRRVLWRGDARCSIVNLPRQVDHRLNPRDKLLAGADHYVHLLFRRRLRRNARVVRAGDPTLAGELSPLLWPRVLPAGQASGLSVPAVREHPDAVSRPPMTPMEKGRSQRSPAPESPPPGLLQLQNHLHLHTRPQRELDHRQRRAGVLAGFAEDVA